MDAAFRRHCLELPVEQRVKVANSITLTMDPEYLALASELILSARNELCAEVQNQPDALESQLASLTIAEQIDLWRDHVVEADGTGSAAQRSRHVLDVLAAIWTERAGQPPEYREIGFTAQGQHGRGNSIVLDQKIGMLRIMGYSVGYSSKLSTKDRRNVLAEVFSSTLPPVFHATYMSEWGEPGSALRLEKIVNSLAAFIALREGRAEDWSQAIADWRGDLLFLKAQIYDRRFHFSWPSTR